MTEATQLREDTAHIAITAAKRIARLEISLEEMIAIYWGDGDGIHPPPQCIIRAMAALQDIPMDGML